jgi:hypothetical protein
MFDYMNINFDDHYCRPKKISNTGIIGVMINNGSMMTWVLAQ